MKRSEAIKLILNTFEFEGLGTQMRVQDAIMILDALLKAGMTPPYWIKSVEGRWGCEKRTGWEPEDE